MKGLFGHQSLDVLLRLSNESIGIVLQVSSQINSKSFRCASDLVRWGIQRHYRIEHAFLNTFLHAPENHLLLFTDVELGNLFVLGSDLEVLAYGLVVLGQECKLSQMPALDNLDPILAIQELDHCPICRFSN